jgi:DNA-binding XRE family transcriptional regulator
MRKTTARRADDELDDGYDELNEFIAEQSSASRSFADAYVDALRRSEVIRLLVARRHRSQLRQTDVAESMGTTQSCVSELESGEKDPHLSTLQRYARAVGVELGLAVRSEGRVVEQLACVRAPRREWAPEWTRGHHPAEMHRVAS